MNIYRHKFYSVCPNNSAIIAYELEIATTDVIQVEHIVTACAIEKSSFHEDIADRLAERFGGQQTLRAHHHGVDIESRRNGSLRRKASSLSAIFPTFMRAYCRLAWPCVRTSIRRIQKIP